MALAHELAARYWLGCEAEPCARARLVNLRGVTFFRKPFTPERLAWRIREVLAAASPDLVAGA
jgi:hypothetical protein